MQNTIQARDVESYSSGGNSFEVGEKTCQRGPSSVFDDVV